MRRVLSGPAPEQSSAEATPAAQHGMPAVQRALDFARGAWSRQNLAPDRVAVLLEKASEESEGIHFSVPYRALFKELEDSRISIEIGEETDFRGARAMFVLDSTTAEGGVLRIKPPAAGASARELREFAATVTHEMQHAFDSVSGGFKAQTPMQTMKQRKISSELRAFGVEAAAAFKLAIGDSYPQSGGSRRRSSRGSRRADSPPSANSWPWSTTPWTDTSVPARIPSPPSGG
ncbi:hypothetical protein SAMN05216223_104459 [Actinacidiphila yanglinensis]|uniref:Uncharacterized protein n=1 Tax=Actinacidiphila yanglinensis TaxID=310779 RepID=A0A1H5ZDU3_9ACTN|nr:hypothetical protein SAMN05216223_104459 [Actinacidiphila yanglinensis]